MNPQLKTRLVSGVERMLSPRALWPGLLAISLVLSLSLWLLRPVPTRSAVLFFPRAETLTLAGEVRAVLPGQEGMEDSARVLVEELLLGPGDPRNLPAFPRGTRVRETLYRKGRIYLDLTVDAVFSDSVPLATGLQAVRKTLRYNFPALGSVVLTIDGREPDISALPASGEPKKSKNN